MILTLLEGQEFGLPKTATEKLGNHGAVRGESRLEVTSLHKVAFRPVPP